MISRGLFPPEQKRRRRESRETNNLLFINQHILKKVKPFGNNLIMAGKDNRKPTDIIPQTWIIECLKIFNIQDNGINFITWANQNCCVETALGWGKIQRQVF